MKVLLIGSLSLLFALSNAQAACNVQAKVKSPKASSGFIGGVNFSKKQLEALSSLCTVAKIPLTSDEVIKLETEAFNKKIARIKNPKAAKIKQ